MHSSAVENTNTVYICPSEIALFYTARYSKCPGPHGSAKRANYLALIEVSHISKPIFCPDNLVKTSVYSFRSVV